MKTPQKQNSDLFLFYGVGSEYIFHDFVKEAKFIFQTKFSFMELDAMVSDPREYLIQAGNYSRIYFFNSSHILLDNYTFTLTSGNCQHFVPSPLEIIRLLHPYRSVFVPHDLAEPILNQEHPYLNLFHQTWYPYSDKISSTLGLSEYGWIKCVDNLEKSTQASQHVIFFLSDVMWHLNFGLAATYQKFRRIFEYPNIHVNLPAYPGSKQLEQYLRMNQVHLIDENVNASQLMKNYDLVISNGLSSTVVEAHLLGIRSLLIKEDFYQEKRYYSLQNRFPGLYLVNLDLVTRSHIDTMSKDRKPVNKIMPFNTRLALTRLLNI